MRIYQWKGLNYLPRASNIDHMPLLYDIMLPIDFAPCIYCLTCMTSAVPHQYQALYNNFFINQPNYEAFNCETGFTANTCSSGMAQTRSALSSATSTSGTTISIYRITKVTSSLQERVQCTYEHCHRTIIRKNFSGWGSIWLFCNSKFTCINFPNPLVQLSVYINKKSILQFCLQILANKQINK